MMLSILAISVFVFSTTSTFAAAAKTDWALKQGKLTYHVSFPLKNVEGTSENVRGKGHCDDQGCQFLVATPVKSFLSGDGNRDNHMLEVTKAGLYPMVTVDVQFSKIETIPATLDAKAEVKFAGHSHTYDHLKLTLKSDGNRTITTGQVPVKLSDFSVERPSLLTVKIDDATPVDFNLTWE